MLRPWDQPPGWSPRNQTVTLRPLTHAMEFLAAPDYDEGPPALSSEGMPEES
jgi:hypothetical protein